MRKITISLAATVCALLLLGQTAFAQVNGLGVQAKQKYGNTTINCITLNGSDFTPAIILANGTINSASPVSAMIAEAGNKGKLVAAFNGTFFDSYNGSNTTYGKLYQDGESLNNGGYYATLIYGYDGRWRIMQREEVIEYGVENIMMGVACEPRLVKDGVKYIDGGSEGEAFMNATAQRTLLGVKADNTLVAVTGVFNFDTAADLLISIGCVDGMAMDGGASSYLYADGLTLQPAGRELNNIIAIYEGAAPLRAVPEYNSLVMNGKEIAIESYRIGGGNYFKLRDVAYILNGTEKQFDITWDNSAKAMNIVSNTPYTATGTEMEMTADYGSAETPLLNRNKLLYNGNELGACSDQVVMPGYVINDGVYFKLQDIAKMINFAVGFNASGNRIEIDTAFPWVE